MSRQLEAVLQHLLTERKAETLRRGWREMPAWVFCTTIGTMLNKGNARQVASDGEQGRGGPAR